MSRTAVTVLTAFVLAVLSVALIASRRAALGNEIDGTPGNAVWTVVLEAQGELVARNASITTVLPPDFRGQHILGEKFESHELAHTIRTNRDGGQRRAVWGPRPGRPRPQPVRLSYSFRCITGMHRPTPGMVQRTRVLDAAPPEEGRYVRPAPLIESADPEVNQLAERLAGGSSGPRAQVRAFFDYVGGLDEGPAAGALDCLHEEGGDDAGKTDLLVALCRNRKIPARPICGLILADGMPELHSWAEAWIDNYWMPIDPAEHHFSAWRFPENYLVLQLGDQPIRAEGARIQATRFTVAEQPDSLDADAQPPTAFQRFWRGLWRKLSLANLRPEEQGWVKFLLLLPVGALVVCIFRTVIGITTFGTFGPALLGLVCRDPHDFPWALGIFVGIMLTGWIIRRVLDRFHLLMVPRISVLLTCIVILLVICLALLGPEAGTTRGYVALLPLIILTHMIERFWTVETEDGTAASFRTLLGTVIVAVVVALVVNSDLPVNAVRRWLGRAPLVPTDALRTTLFRYPEALGLVLAAQLLLGRYTGYRLTELFRFRDLLLEEYPVSPLSPGGRGVGGEGEKVTPLSPRGRGVGGEGEKSGNLNPSPPTPLPPGERGESGGQP